jgi:hypothetical protein
LGVGLVVAFAVACAACGGSAPEVVAPPKPPPGKLGEACTSASAGVSQGSCGAGLVCLTSFPGGYCSQVGACTGGTAFDTLGGELCGKGCAADTDCRGAGYGCDPTWSVCVPPGQTVPKAPTCQGTPLAHKAFGKVTALTTAKAGGTTFGPSAALDKDGSLVVAYNIGLSMLGASTIGTTKATVGATEVTVADGDRAAAFEHDNKVDPWLEEDRNGKLFLAWLGFDGNAAQQHMQVLVATSDDGGATWSKPVVASDSAADCAGDQAKCLSSPILTIGPDRNNPKTDVVYVFYNSAVTGGLRATHSSDGGATFSPSAAVGPGMYADAEVTSSGKLHVVYTAAGSGSKLGDPSNGVYYTNSSDGGATFAAPVRISPESDAVPVYFSSPNVVVDVPRRLLYAVYPAGGSDGKWSIVLATSKDGGVTWGRTTVNDDPSCATHMLPAAALDPATGKVHIVWLENRTGQGQVGYAACATGGDKCGKNEAASDTPSASFSLVRGSNRALGDSIDAIVDAKHKVLHAVWTQTVDEGGTQVGRVFTAAAKLK